MKINIDHLSELELIDLNTRIVERLRMLHQMHAHVRMLEFSIGERVCFETDRRTMVEGVLVRYNKKSVTVVTDDGGKWTVSPSLLRKATPASGLRETGKVIDVEEIRSGFRRQG